MEGDGPLFKNIVNFIENVINYVEIYYMKSKENACILFFPAV